MFNPADINAEWTLFLDRDGVINHEKEMDYVYNYEEFIFYDGALEALKKFARLFHHIVIVTNQRGVGKGWMTEQALINIHDAMIKDIVLHEGRIDKIYYCTSLSNDHSHRKPNPGMALQAMADHPGIKKEKSIMVGNNLSDMSFGRNAGLFTVLLTTTGTRVELPHPLVDAQYSTLIEFAATLPEPS